MSERTIYVIPEPHGGGWLVQSPEDRSRSTTPYFSETEAEHVARRRIRASGNGRIVIRDRYGRLHEQIVRSARG
jgi:hypothetical protein